MSAIVAGRYRVDRPLGRGSSAAVFAARDTWNHEQPVALKVLTLRGAAAEASLAREFAVLVRIRHPHIARVQQFGRLGPDDRLEDIDVGSAFLVQELVGGRRSHEWASGRSAEEVALVGAQLAAALATMHAHGLRHGDIQPANVLVEGSGADARARIIDFGLAGRGASHGVAGTPGFFAPEVLAGGAVCASDVYALGAVLVTLLSGEVPRTAPAEALSSPRLGEAVAAMTHPDPRRRASAATAFELLCTETRSLAAALDTLRDATALPQTLLGRDDVIAVIDDALSTASTSPGTHVLRIAGAPGVGRTAVLTEAAARAATAGFRVPGAVRSAYRRGDLSLLHALVAELGAPAPALAESAAARASHPGRDLTAAQWPHFVAIADGLKEAGREARLAVVLDDVPDGSPLDAMGRFLERLGHDGPSLLWVQSGGTAQTGAIELGPLDAAAISTLIETCRPLRPTDRHAADALHQASGGNPRVAVDILLALPGDRLMESANRGEMHLAAPADAAFELRLQALEDGARSLAIAASLLRTPVAASPLLRAPAVAAQLSSRSVERACAAGVLVAHPSHEGLRVACPSETLRRRLRALASPEMLRDVAEAIESAGWHESHAAELGMLWKRLGSLERARSALLAGARQAAADLRHADALALYDELLELETPDGAGKAAARIESGWLLIGLGRPQEARDRFLEIAERPEATLGLGEALLQMGRYEEAAHALRSNLEHLGDQRAEAEARAAWAAMLAGAYDEAIDTIDAARRRQDPHPQEARLRSALGLIAFYRGDGKRAATLLTEALALAEQGADASLTDRTRANLALVAQKTGDLPTAEGLHEASLAAAKRAHDVPRQILRLVNLATLRQEQGKFEAALTDYREAHDLARLIDGAREAVRAGLNWGNLLLTLGDHEQASVRVGEALAEARRLTMMTEEAYLELLRAEVSLTRGEPSTAASAIARARELFTRADNRVGLAETSVVEAEAALFRRDLASALELASAAAVEARQCGRERVEAHACLWRALASLDASQDHLAGGLRAAMRAAEIARERHDPDLGWLAQAAASRLHRRMGSDVDGDYHATKARQLASAVRSRLSAAHERSYGNVWYRRELWAQVREEASGALPALQPTRDFDRLLAINRELAQDHDPDRLLERIIDAAIALSGAERGFIVLGGPPSRAVPRAGAAADASHEVTGDAEAELVVRVARNFDKQSLNPSDLEISRSIAVRAMNTGGPVVSVDAQGDARFEQFRSVHALNLRSVLCLPLRTQGGTLGALYLDHRHRASAFSDADVALLLAFGDQAAIALYNAQLVAELRQRGRELEQSRQEVEDLNQRLEQELRARSAELDAARVQQKQAGEHPVGRFAMVGRCSAMRDIYRIIERVADKDVPVAILGESGTGKELVARAIHNVAEKREGPFVSINCGAIPAELIESELFGHEKGSFTGAVRRKPGLFEVAHKGTLLLDEVGELPLGMQVKLLRVLQQREVRRVGGTEVVPTTARVLSASNRDLGAMVREGTFREDLWYRLNVVEVHVPPLRERRDDLPLVIEHLLKRHAGSARPEIHRAAMAALLDYPWPGNIRELENEIQRALALSEGAIGLEDLSSKLQHQSRDRAGTTANREGSLKDMVDSFEREALRLALRRHGGQVAACARALQLTRAGLYKKLHKHDLKPRGD